VSNETPDQPTPLAQTATNWVNRRGKHEPDLTDPETAWGRCLIETKRFVDYTAATHDLKLIEVLGQNYPGRSHWAAISFDEEHPEDSPIVDVTLRQFIYDADIPWVGTLVDWYDLVLDGLVDYINVAVYDDPQAEPIWTDSYDREDLEPGANSYPWDRPKPNDVPETPAEPEPLDIDATAEIAAARSDALDVPEKIEPETDAEARPDPKKAEAPS
jgi:hypothetical protein